MRIIYFDIDSLRPDHLGCYGYHRKTSPTIDRLASEGRRFDNVYVSDAPCLPSRTALWSGRFGFHTGVVNHGGTAAQPFPQPDRGVTDTLHDTSWMTALRKAGFETISISSFAERHAAWHWYAGFNEIYNCGHEGMERADDVSPIAIDWLQRRGKADRWFLHINFWDPHIPYRTPLEYGQPFAESPLPERIDENLWRRGWDGYGPHSPREPHGFGGETYFLGFPRFPESIDSMDAVKAWIDGYDTGIRYADDHIGRIVNQLEQLDILDDTVVIVSADHGESQGEFNIWGDHQTADHSTCRIPLIIRWPDRFDAGSVDASLRYHLDWGATLIEGVGGSVPGNWDGLSFLANDADTVDRGRPYLVLSQGAHVCQRGIRFDDGPKAYLCLWTLNPGYKMLDPLMLFNLSDDPLQQQDISEEFPHLVQRAMGYYASWLREAMVSGDSSIDPLLISLREGPLHARGQLEPYAQRLAASGRGDLVDDLRARQAGIDG
ncbi:MAG: sulfatase [Rhodothermia bacterium]|nr:sulfatase [Rhodothermia bacterium]